MHHDTNLQPQVNESEAENSFVARLRRWRWFALFVVLPTALAILYYGAVAADIYVSESRFVIKAPERQRTSGGALGSLLQTTSLGSRDSPANEIIGYLQSRDALADLSTRVNVRGAFSSSEADVFSRFPLLFQSESIEDLYSYYRSMVSATQGTTTDLTVLHTSAFTAREAQELNVALLRLSEELVNRLNRRANSQAIKEAQDRVATAQQRVRLARMQLSAYRNSSEIFNPEQQGIGVLTVSNELTAREAALRAQLSEIQGIAPDHPSIPALRERIRAISQQVAAQNRRAVGSPEGLASRMTEYENLTVEQEFATQTLTAANAALEQARVEARQQQYYLERVVEPNLPDAPILPNRLKAILAVLFASLCLYLVGWMLIVGIIEHAPED